MASNKYNKSKQFLKQISTIFFDLDNTLIQTRKSDVKTCSKLAENLQEQHGMSFEVATICTTTYLKAFRRCPDSTDVPLDTWRCHLWTQALPDSHKHLSHEIYKKWLQLRYYYLTITPEISSLLQQLRQHYLLGLITNGPTNAQWEKIKRLNLNKYFDCILVSDDLPWEKPNENIFFAACNYLGVEPHQCLMVGDKLETDIQGGKEAKLGATIWIPLNAERPEPGVGPFPDYTIQNVLEISTLLPTTTKMKSPNFRSRSSGSIQFETPYHRRVTSLPDLDNSNSNSSDGS